MLLEGIQLGRYRLLRVIGSGGMGEVYHAEDTTMARYVAMKVIRTERTTFQDSRTQADVARLFQREMHAITRLNHKHILPLYDFGEQRVNNPTLAYMVMPFLAEGSLADWLQRHSVCLLAPQEVVLVVQQAAQALQHAHENGLVHQDVKPSNFLVRNQTNTPYALDLLLADFGIARFTTTMATSSQSIRGTPAYMPPEQWEGRPVPATDQYALAIMAYQLLTGNTPFQGRLEQVMHQHLMTPPKPPSTYDARFAPALDAVILRALEKRPVARFATVIDFAQAFQQAVQPSNNQAPIAYDPRLNSLPPPPAANGRDIRTSLSVGAALAKTGGSQTLPLADGRVVSVPIPSGTRNGQIICLANMGEPSTTGGQPGALLVTVTVPSSLSVRALVLVGLVFLLIISGIVGVTAVHQRNINQAKTTATVLAGLVKNAIDATATGSANATAIVVTATATVASANPDPYAPPHGTLIWYDPLGTHGHWQNDSDTDFGGACQFTGGSYHITQSKSHRFFDCINSDKSFSNFAFDVRMTITQGDCGGLEFRESESTGTGYLFDVCQDGTYKLSLYRGFKGSDATDLLQDQNSAIRQGLGQTNLIAVVADAKTLTLYVNNVQVGHVSDTTYNIGYLGFVADDSHNSTEVVYSKARVWQI